MSGRGLKTVIVIFAVVAVASSAIAVTQYNRARSRDSSNRELAGRLDAAKDRISELEQDNERESDPLEGLLGELGDGSGGLGDLFGGGELGDLLGGDSSGLIDCLTGGATGSDGSDPLGGLFGDIAGGGSGDPQDALDGLFGGLGSGSASAPARSQIPKISKAVEDVRKLRFRERVTVRFMPPERLAKRAARLFLEDYTARMARTEQRMLTALGAIPRGTDLRATAKELLESQVAGFYVPESKKLFVPGAPNEPMSAIEKTIIAHELQHALADERLELPLPEVPDESEIDEHLAALSLVEGDASLTMQRYSLAAIPVFEQLTMLSDPAYTASQQALEGIPSYLVEQLQFPYVNGMNFVCELHKRGGWAAVDRAYEDPPSTSAQVLFPARYRRGEVAAATRPAGSPGGGWNESLDASFGAANLLWLFKAPGTDETAALSEPVDRVSAWGGGRVRMWERGQDTALAVTLVQRRDTTGLCDSVAQWYDAAFDDDSSAPTRTNEELALDGGIQDAVLWCSGHEVRLGIGPDLGTARAVID